MLPLVLALVGLGLEGAGTALNLYGKVKDAKRARDEMDREIQYLDAQEADVFKRSVMEAGRARIEGDMLAGQQQVAASTSALRATPGQQLEGVMNARVDTETNVELIKNNAFREAWGIREHAASVGRRKQQLQEDLPLQLAAGALSGLGHAAGDAYGAFGSGKGMR